MNVVRCPECESENTEYTDDNLDELFQNEDLPSDFLYRRFYTCHECSNEFSEDYVFDITFGGYTKL